jgi:hypothetical protein
MNQIDQAQPDITELIELFTCFYDTFKNSFLIVDGLDEAEKSDQRNIKSFLKELQKLDCARILIIGHPDVDMSKVISQSQTLQIKPEDVKGDIEVFVQKQMDEHSQVELSNCSTSELDKIKLALISGAEEMSVRS